MNARWRILLATASTCWAGEPGILCVRGSTVLSLDHRGTVLRTVRLPFEPEWVSGASDGSILYSAGKCSPPASLTFASIDRPGKGTRVLAPPLRGAGEIRMEVWTPVFSPDGRTIAAVDAPCPSVGDASENGGFVVTVSSTNGAAKVLFASHDADGVPIGVAMSPMWSADGQRILVSYETGFRIYEAEFGRAVYRDDNLALVRGWSTAIGWIGGNCIVPREGD